MGIKDINKLLNELCPEAIIKVPLSCFSNKAIAIDSHLLLYKYFSVATKNYVNSMKDPRDLIDKRVIKKDVIERIMNFNKVFFQHMITPVWIFDGIPVESKMDCLKERKEIKIKKQEKIEEDKAILNEMNPFKITEEDFKGLKTKLSGCVNMNMDDINEIRILLKTLGIPMFIANGDGEKLCSSLNRENNVSAVWSIDTDNIALGTPIMIKEFLKYEGKTYVELLQLSTVLGKLNISLSFLTDLCIMLGCDFNKNIPSIGQKKAYQLMIEYRSIDSLPEMYKKIHLDKSVLNYEECRKLFSYEKSNINPSELIINWDMYFMNIEEQLIKYSINGREYTKISSWESEIEI